MYYRHRKVKDVFSDLLGVLLHTLRSVDILMQQTISYLNPLIPRNTSITIFIANYTDLDGQYQLFAKCFLCISCIQTAEQVQSHAVQL